MSAVEVKVKQLEAKLSEQVQNAHDGVDEVRVKVVQSENERKKMIDKLEMNTTDVKKLKDELHMLKDVIRRQQEAKHLELKEEFLQFTTQVE